MTFLEAAIEVLRREGRPLNPRELAELAVRHNLLSVVGRDPGSTMQERLTDAVEKDTAHVSELFQVRPGMYGLRSYPARPYPPVADDAPAPAAPGEPAGEPPVPPALEASEPGEAQPASKRRRRRRGEKPAAATSASDGGAAEPTAVDLPAPVAPVASDGESVAVDGPAAESTAPEGAGDEPRRRRRRGGRGRRRRGEVADQRVSATATAEGDQAPEPSELALASEEPEPLDQPDPIDHELDEELEIDLASGPLLAPTHGAEELVRGDEERTMRAEIQGRGDEHRDRHRRREGRRPGKKGDRESEGSRARSHEPQRESPRNGRGQPPTSAQRAPERETAPSLPGGAPRRDEPASRDRAATGSAAPPKGRVSELYDAVDEVLRGAEGRGLHVRQIVDALLNRRLVDGRGGPQELTRHIRAALVREQRDREAAGLRSRVRNLGGGQYAVAGRKLEPELAVAERELAERATRLREATRAALRHRLSRMSPPAFEALGRALCEKLGLTAIELVRRGDQVAYFGGSRIVGVQTLTTLVAMRPGETEISRRAVGELRAGLKMRNFGEGILLSPARASTEALTELAAGSGVTVYDGASLAALLQQHGIGVRRLLVPVEYLDLELFGELTES